MPRLRRHSSTATCVRCPRSPRTRSSSPESRNSALRRTGLPRRRFRMSRRTCPRRLSTSPASTSTPGVPASARHRRRRRPEHYIQAVNTSIGIFSKTGAHARGVHVQLARGRAPGRERHATPATAATRRWSTTRSPTAGSSPTSRSPARQRRRRTTSASPSRKTGDPVTGGWYLYAIRADDAAHPWFPDYPKMGIWPDGLYMTANMFDCDRAPAFREVRVWAFNRTDMESGAAVRTVVVDLEHGGVLQHAAEQHARRRAAGAAGRTSSSPSRRRCSPSRSSSSSRLRGQRLDLHRADERQPDVPTRSRPPTVPSSGEQPRHARASG